MKQYIENRVYSIAEHIKETKQTVRATSKVFHVSKSTVHKDVSERLPQLSPELYKEIKVILDNNFDIKHIHGGIATHNKYEELKTKVNF